MSKWRKVKFQDLFALPSRNGLTKPSRVRGSGYKMINMGELFSNGRIYDIPMELVPLNDKEKEVAKVERYDLLFARQSLVLEGAGKCSIVMDVSDLTTFESHLIRVRLDYNIANPLFYYYYFSSSLSPISSIVSQCAQAGIKGSDLVQIMVDFPPLHIQHRIATILSRYDSLIENYQKQIKLLEESAQRLYKEWFIELRFPGHENTKIVDGVPEGWEKKKITELVNVQYGYAFDGKLFNSNSEGMPILRIRNIPDGITSDYTTEEASADYVVHNGDIVVGMDGIFHINTWSGGDAYLVQRACSFRPIEEVIKGFIFLAIKEPIKYFEQTLVGSTVAHLGKKHIDSIEILVPNRKELFKSLQDIFNQRQNMLYQIRHLTEARDRLLPKLMSEEIKIN